MAAHVQNVFMLFGDSITQGAWEPGMNGFGERLSHLYARKLDVLNRGYSGYNTEWAIPVFEQCIARHIDQNAPKVRVLTVWFGANDACIKPSPQHVPLPKFIANLRQIVRMIHSPDSPYYYPDTRILLITPPPINTHQRKADLESRNPPLQLDRLFDTTKEYAEAVKNVAQEEKVGLVDVWTALWEAAEKDETALSKFLTDGLHLNPEGYRVMFEQLMETIAEIYPEVHHERLDYVFPPWAEINWDSPAESLYVPILTLTVASRALIVIHFGGRGKFGPISVHTPGLLFPVFLHKYFARPPPSTHSLRLQPVVKIDPRLVRSST